MKRLLVLGAGTAGTMVVNKLRRHLAVDDWAITVVDRDDVHPYQPGLLFVPFGDYVPDSLTRSRHAQLADRVDFVISDIDRIDADHDTVLLADGRHLDYDVLVIATGATTRPDQTPGMLGKEWRHTIFDFYTMDGALALETALGNITSGRVVIHITDMPIKCPVAPLEFAFLADDFFRSRGIRDQIDMAYVTPLSGAFTKPVASKRLGSMLDERNISLETDFLIEQVDDEARELVSYDERRVPFDLLVTVPLTMGADFIARSGLGDELNFVPVDKRSFRSTSHDNVYALGDASDIPASKAGSVAHFSVDVFVENFVAWTRGEPAPSAFDGHANCFVESGQGKGLLIDFNYDTEPLPGRYPIPGVGPFTLLSESRANHLGKLSFRWMYWNVLLPGRPIPLPTHMSMAGKQREGELACP